VTEQHFPPTMRTSTFLSVAAALTSSVSATVYQGFNYGSTFTDSTAKTQADFEAEFTAAKNLVGTSGAFTSARLYTMIVCSPLEAGCVANEQF
jgi:glucan endo-1,3-beta-D-glucosidase